MITYGGEMLDLEKSNMNGKIWEIAEAIILTDEYSAQVEICKN